jgi:hypothetical protein
MGSLLRCVTGWAAAFMATTHPSYSVMAARVAVSNLHKTTPAKFSEACARMAACVHPKTKTPSPLVAEEFAAFVSAHADELDAAIRHERDFEYVLHLHVMETRLVVEPHLHVHVQWGQVRLLWVQDAGAVVLGTRGGRRGGAAPVHVHARGRGLAQGM